MNDYVYKCFKFVKLSLFSFFVYTFLNRVNTIVNTFLNYKIHFIIFK